MVKVGISAMRLKGLTLGVAILAATTLAQPAQAQTPEQLSYRYVDRWSCDFPVRVRGEGKFSVKEFERPNGRFAYKMIETSPGLKATVTNLDTGKSQRYSLAGPGIIKVRRDTGIFTLARLGPWGLWPFHPTTGEEGMWVTRGRYFVELDRRFNVITERFTGRALDVCAALS